MAINWLAIIAATAAAWIFGAIWYGALSKQWMAAIGFTDADMKDASGKTKIPVIPMIVSLIAEFVMALVLAGVISNLWMRPLMALSFHLLDFILAPLQALFG